jgi:N-acetylglucosaminyldiphosphoundecaprenol N-acetyl-beta-D-mannosaminyltransferase
MATSELAMLGSGTKWESKAAGNLCKWCRYHLIRGDQADSILFFWNKWPLLRSLHHEIGNRTCRLMRNDETHALDACAKGHFVDTSFWTPFRRCSIGGLDIVTASRAELASAMVADCLAVRVHQPGTRPRLIFDANGHALSLLETDPDYRNAVYHGDVIHADGGFLVMLSRWLASEPISERSATTDMIHDLARVAAANNLSFYLLGGTESVNAECARRLTSWYPGLSIVGRHHGYYSAEAEGRLVEDINRARPDVLWVGLGKPKEQTFCVRWRDQLMAGWIVTCGGCYNFVTGHYKRAPAWMQRANLEWLYRLSTNPRRLFWRYLTTNPRALWLVIRKCWI